MEKGLTNWMKQSGSEKKQIISMGRIRYLPRNPPKAQPSVTDIDREEYQQPYSMETHINRRREDGKATHPPTPTDLGIPESSSDVWIDDCGWKDSRSACSPDGNARTDKGSRWIRKKEAHHFQFLSYWYSVDVLLLSRLRVNVGWSWRSRVAKESVVPLSAFSYIQNGRATNGGKPRKSKQNALFLIHVYNADAFFKIL